MFKSTIKSKIIKGYLSDKAEIQIKYHA